MGTLGAVLLGGFISMVTTYQTQTWIARRERRYQHEVQKRDVYLKVIELIPDNQLALAVAQSNEGVQEVAKNTQLQQNQLRIGHELKLLAPKQVCDAYDRYRKLVRKEVGTTDLNFKPKNPDEVDDARDQLVKLMRDDLQSELSED